MIVPEQVKKEADWLIDRYDESFDYLGNYEGADFFVYQFPEEVTIGFPYVFQYENGSVLTITGFEALDVIDLFVKDIDEINVE